MTGTTEAHDGRVVDFYFDFISPFGFFASLRIDELAARHGYATRWHSMLIGVSVLKVMGMKPLLETPLKGPYILRDANRYARRHGIALGRRLDAPMADPRPAGRAFHWLAEHRPPQAKAFAQAVYSAYWRDDRDIADSGVLGEIVGVLLPGDATATAGISSAEADRLLRAGVERSLARGVFGSPFFLVGDEPFFGVEKMELLEEWLAEGGW